MPETLAENVLIAIVAVIVIGAALVALMSIGNTTDTSMPMTSSETFPATGNASQTFSLKYPIASTPSVYILNGSVWQHVSPAEVSWSQTDGTVTVSSNGLKI